MPTKRIGDNAVRSTRQLHFLDRLVHRDAAELVGEDLGEPQRIVVGSSYAHRSRSGSGQFAHSDAFSRRQPADRVALTEREPQRVVGAGDDHRRRAADRRPAGQLAVHRDAADVTRCHGGEPQRAVRARGDAEGTAALLQLERGQLAGRGDPADAVVTDAGEPHCAMGPAVMIDGRDCGSTGYTVTSPPFVTRAIEPLCTSVTHIAPSGPAASAYGPPSIETLRAALTPA